VAVPGRPLWRPPWLWAYAILFVFFRGHDGREDILPGGGVTSTSLAAGARGPADGPGLAARAGPAPRLLLATPGEWF